jgi:hypothetical protein
MMDSLLVMTDRIDSEDKEELIQVDTMALRLLNFLVAGAVFGAALTVAGAFQPSVVINQMQFQSFDMMRTFIVASVTSV